MLIAHTDQQQKSRGILSACWHCCHLPSGSGVHCKHGPLPLPHSELRVTYFLYAAVAAQPRYGIGGVAVAPSHRAKIALLSDQEPKGITCKEAERIQWRSHVPAMVTVAWSILKQVWPLITRLFHEHEKQLGSLLIIGTVMYRVNTIMMRFLQLTKKAAKRQPFQLNN